MKKQTLIVPWIGQSLNASYASKHWSQRKKNSDAGHKSTFFSVKEQKIEPVHSYPITLIATPILCKGKRRYDVSNYALSVKIIEDGLIKQGILIDDSNKFVERWVINSALRGKYNGIQIEILEKYYDEG